MMPTALNGQDQSRERIATATDRLGPAGTSRGINIEPGCNDDGWIVPDPAALADGSRVQLYKDGEALRAAYRAIESAQRRICLEVYIFHSDDTGRAFSELLCHKARQGVQVYVIYDSFGSAQSDRGMFRQMRRSGVHIQEFHPIRPWECRYGWRPANRDHRKLLLIDDTIAWMGGLNIGGEYAGPWVVPSALAETDLWRDNAIGVVGPSARPFLRAFSNSWRYVTTGGRIGKAEFIYNIGPAASALVSGARPHSDRLTRQNAHAPGARRRSTYAGTSAGYRGGLVCPAIEPGADVGVLASVPMISSPLAGVFQRLLRSACRGIQMTMAYFAPRDELIGELCAAARRGVRVQLMLPGKTDVRLLVTAARSFYETLLAAGVEIYERQGVVLHAKTLVIDSRTTVIGSTNMDYRSIEYNCELSAIVRSETFGRQMNDLFAHDARYAKPIALGEWRHRPLLDRIVQRVVNRVRYLL
jgi:cardiolipin synthase